MTPTRVKIVPTWKTTKTSVKSSPQTQKTSVKSSPFFRHWVTALKTVSEATFFCLFHNFLSKKRRIHKKVVSSADRAHHPSSLISQNVRQILTVLHFKNTKTSVKSPPFCCPAPATPRPFTSLKSTFDRRRWKNVHQILTVNSKNVRQIFTVSKSSRH